MKTKKKKTMSRKNQFEKAVRGLFSNIREYRECTHPGLGAPFVEVNLTLGSYEPIVTYRQLTVLAELFDTGDIEVCYADRRGYRPDDDATEIEGYLIARDVLFSKARMAAGVKK